MYLDIQTFQASVSVCSTQLSRVQHGVYNTLTKRIILNWHDMKKKFEIIAEVLKSQI